MKRFPIVDQMVFGLKQRRMYDVVLVLRLLQSKPQIILKRLILQK